MRLADNTGSWRVSSGGSQACEMALFVRDATRLPVLTSDVPVLLGEVPDLTGGLSAAPRQAAGGRWRQWWQQLLDFEVRDRLARQDDAQARRRALISERQAVSDPPEFEALAERPGLRAAARASFDSFRDWESARRPRHPIGRPEQVLDWSVMKQVAEDVAFDRQVRLDEVQARVLVLPVRSSWWRRQAPGVMLCSPAAARDPATSQALLRDAFDSHLARPQ